MHADARGWVSADRAGDSWQLLLGDGDDGPEVWRRSRDRLWRVRFWRGEICVMRAGPCARKVDAQELALAELEAAGVMPGYRERPGRLHALATLSKEK
jgi:hypothetical protein